MARPVWVDKEKQWGCWLEILFIEAKNKGEAKDMSMTHMQRMLQISANNYTRDTSIIWIPLISLWLLQLPYAHIMVLYKSEQSVEGNSKIDIYG